MPFVMTTATCPPSRAGNQFARNSLTLSLDILITIYTMSKNITQNKTEFIQFRLDRDSKITAKALAEKYSTCTVENLNAAISNISPHFPL